MEKQIFTICFKCGAKALISSYENDIDFRLCFECGLYIEKKRNRNWPRKYIILGDDYE